MSGAVIGRVQADDGRGSKLEGDVSKGGRARAELEGRQDEYPTHCLIIFERHITRAVNSEQLFLG